MVERDRCVSGSRPRLNKKSKTTVSQDQKHFTNLCRLFCLPVSAQFGAWNVGGFGRLKDMSCVEHWIGAGRTMGLLQALETQHRKCPNCVKCEWSKLLTWMIWPGALSCGSDVVYVTNSWLSKLPHVQLSCRSASTMHDARRTMGGTSRCNP